MHVRVPHRRVLRSGAVLAGMTALVFNMEPQPRDTARAAQGAGTIAVTVEEGTNLSITRASDGSIVMDLHGFLYRIPAQGGRARRLTDVLLEPARPEYSPDGTRIAFQAYAGGTFHIWTMAADGGDLRQLTDGPYDDREPQWSPDGTRIAFASDRGADRTSPPDVGGSYDIWSIDVTTGELRQWTTTPTLEEEEPAWSPDGTEIAFVVSNNAIEAVDAAGNRRTLVAPRPGTTLFSPSWNPSGADVAYLATSGGQSNLWVGGRQITSGQDVFVVSNPEWISEREVMYAADGKIRLVDVGSGAFRDVPFSATLDLPAVAYEKKRYDFDSTSPRPVKGILTPALGPDGRTIAFVALNDLWLMEIGEEPRRLTHDTYYEAEPAWSRDGRFLAYSSDRAGTPDIYVRDLRTGTERRVTGFDEGAEIAPAWSPNGRTIAFQNEASATFTVDLGSGDVRQVLGPLFEPGRPTWSADGNTIALAALRRYSGRFREGTSQILTVDLTTGEQAYHAPGGRHDSIATRGDDGPVWSPDGRWMAFVVDSTLRVMPVSAIGAPTGPARPITAEATDAISWSGDSERLLYLSNGRLRLVGRDGSQPRGVPLRLEYRPARPEGRTVIHAGRLWDGTSPTVRENVDIEVVGNRIRSVTPHTGPLRGGSVDASTLTVIPGLWDTHVHQENEARLFGDRTGRGFLAYGVTSTLSVGDKVYRAVEDREALRAGARVGPRFFAMGEPIDGSRIFYDFMRPTTSLDQVVLELTRVRELDYDYMKTYVRLPADRMEVASDTGHQLGIPGGSHYFAPGAFVGQDGTTHLAATQRLGFARTETATTSTYADVVAAYGAGRRFMETTNATNATLFPYDCAADARARLFPPWRDATCGTQPPDPDPQCQTGACKRARTFARVREAGGTILTGTDFPLGGDLALTIHAEIRSLVLYGWTPYEALLTATRNPAKHLGIERDLGTLEPGKLADMAFVEGNPLARIEDTLNVRMTMINGVLYTTQQIIDGFFAPAGEGTPPNASKAGAPKAAGNPVHARLGKGPAHPKHRLLPPVPDHPANKRWWWHAAEHVTDTGYHHGAGH
jgi:Tol biopolymer transport system component